VQRRFMRGTYERREMDSKASEKEVAATRAKMCAISNEVLQEPVVACELGNLYNKEAILTCLLEKTLNESYQHIRGLKDLVEVQFTQNPSFVERETNTEIELLSELPAKYICPVTLIEMNGSQPFVLLWRSGWILSEKALKEVGVQSLQTEYGPFEEGDVVKLAPSDKELPAQIEQMRSRRARAKAEKQKRKREKLQAAQELESKDDEACSERSSKKSKKKKEKREKQHKLLKAQKQESSIQLGHSTNSQVKEEAASAVKKQQESSSVYKSIFSTKKKRDDEDLFIRSGGMRYTLS